MKIILSLTLALFIVEIADAQEISYPEELSSFELTIEGISEDKGEIRIAVFNSEASYNEKEDPIHAIVLPVNGGTLIWDEEKLPYGDYAIAVYHDRNTNGELDSNILGIPKEAYGFSNNARGRFGPASWKDVHFTISSRTYSMSIQVK
jgi:uncharacterized protein (DUF2141 family)